MTWFLRDRSAIRFDTVFVVLKLLLLKLQNPNLIFSRNLILELMLDLIVFIFICMHKVTIRVDTWL